MTSRLAKKNNLKINYNHILFLSVLLDSGRDLLFTSSMLHLTDNPQLQQAGTTSISFIKSIIL
jgi:hypothetical protein